MNRERLTHLIAVLERVEAQRLNFDLNRFVAAASDYSSSADPVIPIISEPCGTSACAAGYAAMDPTFMEQGLRLKFTPADETDEVLYDPKVHGDRIQIDPESGGYPVYGRFSTCEALKAFFDLDGDTTDYLFYPHKYPANTTVGPRQVIERIQEVLAR